MRSLLAFALVLALGACREAPEAPSPDGEGPTTVPSELPADLGQTDDGVIDGAAPGFIGATAPELGLILDDGGVCYVYEAYVVRVEPIGTDGEPRGDRVRVGDRPDGAASRAMCDAASRAVTGEDEVDTFSGVEGEILLLDRASGETGRRLVALDLASGDAVVLNDAYEEPVEIENGAVTYGALVREATTPDALAGVACEQGADYLANGLAVGVVQLRRFSFESRETTDTGALTCVPLG